MKLVDRVMDWLEVRPLWQICVGVLLVFALLVMLVGCDDRPMVCLGYAKQRLAVIESCARTPRCSLSTEDLREMDFLRSSNVVYIRCGDDR